MSDQAGQEGLTPKVTSSWLSNPGRRVAAPVQPGKLGCRNATPPRQA